MKGLIAFFLVLFSVEAFSQTVNNSTTNKRYDAMPVGSAIWTTSTTFKTYIDDTKSKIDSLVNPQPFSKSFANADSVVVLKTEHLISKVLNVRVENIDGSMSIVPTKINRTTGKVVVKFFKKKTGTLYIN